MVVICLWIKSRTSVLCRHSNALRWKRLLPWLVHTECMCNKIVPCILQICVIVVLVGNWKWSVSAREVLTALLWCCMLCLVVAYHHSVSSDSSWIKNGYHFKLCACEWTCVCAPVYMNADAAGGQSCWALELTWVPARAVSASSRPPLQLLSRNRFDRFATLFSTEDTHFINLHIVL